MILADYIAIGAAVIFGCIGAAFGFGKVLKMFAKGIIGVIASVFLTYLLFNLVFKLGFVQELLMKFTDWLTSLDNGFAKFLLNIRIDFIVTAIVLFLVIRILIRLFAGALASFFGSNVALIKGLNSLLGAALGLALMAALVLVVMQVAYILDSTREPALEFLTGSFFRLDYVYLNNPFALVWNMIA